MAPFVAAEAPGPAVAEATASLPATAAPAPAAAELPRTGGLLGLTAGLSLLAGGGAIRVLRRVSGSRS